MNYILKNVVPPGSTREQWEIVVISGKYAKLNFTHKQTLSKYNKFQT